MLLVLRLYPIQVVISLPLWIKLTMGQLLLFLCETSAAFSAYVRGVLGTNRFSQFVIDWLVCFGYSANNNTQGAFPIFFLICSDLLNCLRNLGTMYITTESVWAIHWAIPHKSLHFSLFWYMHCTATQDISSSSKNINSTARISRLSSVSCGYALKVHSQFWENVWQLNAL